MTLPSEFIASLAPYAELRGLPDALSAGEPTVSVRVNAGKPAPSWLDTSDPVPWCRGGFYLDGRHDFTRDPAFHQGRYYVQEASSMFISHVLSSLPIASARPVVLDACAAPGGKTTAAIDALPGGSIVVANEFSAVRCAVLQDNLMKHGTPNVIVTQGDAMGYGKFTERFDVIIADVPCSGEGMMRKDPVAAAQWSPQLVAQCAATQRAIVTELWKALKPGGYMVYSTCTFNRHENEEMIDYLVSELGARSVEIGGIRESWGISQGIDTPHHCHRFIPGRTRGEGLFMAVVAKDGEPPEVRQARRKLPKPYPGSGKYLFEPLNSLCGPEVLQLAGELAKLTKVKAAGVALDPKAVPSHAQLMQRDFDLSCFNTCPVSARQALDYLRGNAITIDAPRGPVVLTHDGQPLGLAKNLVSRANNLYPQRLRIRSTY